MNEDKTIGGSDVRTGESDAFFKISGMTCGSCVAQIEQMLVDQAGVSSATVDLESGRAVVRITPEASPEQMMALVTEAGYPMVTLTSQEEKKDGRRFRFLKRRSGRS